MSAGELYRKDSGHGITGGFMRKRSERLDVLQALTQKCLDEVGALPTEEFIEELRQKEMAQKNGGNPGPPAIISRSVAITKYISTGVTALKEMGQIVRKEYTQKGDALEKEIAEEKNVDLLESLQLQLTKNDPRDGRQSPA